MEKLNIGQWTLDEERSCHIMKLSDIGLIGLAVMGQNLVLNMEGKGYSVSVYNELLKEQRNLCQAPQRKEGITAAYTLKILLHPGPSAENHNYGKGRASGSSVIDKLVPLLTRDIVMDGRNSYLRTP